MQITHAISLDFQRYKTPSQIDVSQGDTYSRYIKITLFNNMSEWPVPDGVTVAVRFKKPDRTQGVYDTLPNGAVAYSVEGNTITVGVAPQMLTVKGKVTASVVVFLGSAQLATFPFVLNVVENPAAGQSISNDYYYLQTWDDINNAIGNLSNLQTDDKSSLVAAINEIFNTGNNSDSEQNGNGLSIAASALLITILRNGVYSSDQSGNITALEDALASSGDTGGGEEEPDVPDTVTYTVTNKLTNVSSSNAAGTVVENAAYTATLTAAAGYELGTVTVTMGGTNITATAYSGGKITIAAVTGNVVITATAVQAATGEEVAMTGTVLSGISAFTAYSDEGQTVLDCNDSTTHLETPIEFVSDETFVENTAVKITRSAVSSSAWRTLVIGECDPGDTSVIYNASVNEASFGAPSTERVFDYTVHAGRKLVYIRRNNNISSFTVTVTK